MAARVAVRRRHRGPFPDDTAVRRRYPQRLMLPASDPGALRAFLEHPSRPAGTLTYHELQGFLFTVVSTPELIPPSEWLPIVFGDQEVDYASAEIAEAIIGQIMTLYRTRRCSTRRRCSPPTPAA